MAYGRMIDRLIYEQVKGHHFHTIIKSDYARFAFHSLELYVFVFPTINFRLDPHNYLVLCYAHRNIKIYMVLELPCMILLHIPSKIKLYFEIIKIGAIFVTKPKIKYFLLNVL